MITGASGYLGRRLAAALAEAGANVVVTSREEATAKAVADTLPVMGKARHHGFSLDQLDPDNLAERFAAVAALTGSIDILVNNGNEHCKSDWTNCSAQEFNRQWTNATGYFLLARHVRDHAVAGKKEASIIMLGSMYGMVGSYPDAYEGICAASPVAYHALKGGILQMTRHLAVYWARDHIRVNALSPGPFPSAAASLPMVDRLCTKSPMRRMGQPHELKGAVVFLASDASSYMTGQNLVIDGGWTAW
ncbi:MAG: SDR family oxidoreductase [Pirellulales bacterium]|nr:SDR family oxidoreductase [Pirellulales bacterium]